MCAFILSTVFEGASCVHVLLLAITRTLKLDGKYRKMEIARNKAYMAHKKSFESCFRCEFCKINSTVNILQLIVKTKRKRHAVI